ncbi:hypothetical protein [Streptomyces sp. NPDC087300]|uniref:terpene synthase family protein n=1 Tax=Streptomyces sp. NPDC087300 TaxID=3365780 RepID=UPI0037FE1EAC
MTTEAALTTESALTLPPFYCPFPPASRPDAEEIESRAVEWITRQGAYRSRAYLDALTRARAGIVVTQAMPDAVPDRVQIAADFMYWGFTFDDGNLDEGALGDQPAEAIEFLGTMARVAENPRSELLPENPWAASLRDLTRRVAACATPEQTQRWITGLQTLFYGLAWETRYRARGRRPDLDTCLMIRRGSIGMEPLTSLNDMADGYLLPPEVYHSPLVRALREICWTLIICDNDLYSFNKENRRDTSYFNYVHSLAQENDTSPRDALPDAVALRDRIMNLFLALREQTTPDAPPELRRYLTSLGLWLRANIDWATSSSRYLPDSGRPRPGALYTDQPVHHRLEPPALPSVDWWWQLLDTRTTTQPGGRSESDLAR